MSTLTDNLQTIYEVKQEIKQVLGTSSDLFTQYPDLIEAAIAGGGTTPTGAYNIVTNGNYDIASYAYAYVAVPAGSAYFYVVRNPEEENEEIIPFTDYTAEAGYPCFGYNFGNFEYTQGSGAQLVICPMNFEDEGEKTVIKAKIESALFTTEGEDPVEIYAAGPVTIETANDSADAQVQIDQFGSASSGDAPAVYIARSINNLEYYIEKPNSSNTWTGRWEWV